MDAMRNSKKITLLTVLFLFAIFNLILDAPRTKSIISSWGASGGDSDGRIGPWYLLEFQSGFLRGGRIPAVFRIQIRMFLGLPDPDPIVRGTEPDPDPPIIEHKYWENLDFYCVVTSLDFLSLKNDINSVADPDPGSGAFFTPGSGMGKILIRIRGEYLRSFSRSSETVFWVKNTEFFDADPDPGPGIVLTLVRDSIPDTQHWMQIYFQKVKTYTKQSCGSMTFWGGSGSVSADPCLWLMDPDWDPDPGSGSWYFRHWPSRCQQKTA